MILQLEMEVRAGAWVEEIVDALNRALDEPPCDWGEWEVGGLRLLKVDEKRAVIPVREVWYHPGAGWAWLQTEGPDEQGICFGFVVSPLCPDGEWGTWFADEPREAGARQAWSADSAIQVSKAMDREALEAWADQRSGVERLDDVESGAFRVRCPACGEVKEFYAASTALDFLSSHRRTCGAVYVLVEERR